MQVVVHDDDAASGADGKENAKIMDMLLDLLPCRLSVGLTRVRLAGQGCLAGGG